jgi:Beta xylosidase C-terminal Concanavalin A-like domain
MRKILIAAVLCVICFIPTLFSHVAQPGLAQAASGPPQGDEFNSTSFQAPFQVRCGNFATAGCPDTQGPTTWALNQASVSPNNLRIMTQFGSLVGIASNSSNNARNFAIQPFDPTTNWTATTKLTFPAISGNFNALGQSAGMLVYQDDDNFIYVSRRFDPSLGSTLQFVQEIGGADAVSTLTETCGATCGTVYLQIQKLGTTYSAWFSYDNITFTPLPPGLLVSTPTATATGTLTPTPTSTSTSTPTNTPSPTPTSTGTLTPSPTPTVTSTPVSSGYTATYGTPLIGVFAWGGTNSAVTNTVNTLPADFDWFRVGNSQTPAPTATPTATNTAVPTGTPTNTVVPTTTATATATPTNTLIPTSTPTETPTSTPTSTPTNTPTPTPTPKPKPKIHAAFQYVSVWYRYIHVLTKQHIVAQAKTQSQYGLWVHVIFPSGKRLDYYVNTDAFGFWQKKFVVPKNAIKGKSGEAFVTFQLWKGNSTKKKFSTFTVIP